MIKSGNPALNKKTFENLIASPQGVMTIDGAAPDSGSCAKNRI